MNTWKQNLAETKQHYIDWWNHKGIILNMWEHLQDGVRPHADIPMPEAPRDMEQKWFDPEWRSRFLDWYVAHSSLMADILPVANTQLGPGSLAAILGGRLEGGEDTIWIHPAPDFKDEIIFDRDNANWLLHKSLLKACKERAQGHYYVGMPDLMEGLDVLAALKGTDTVLLDMVMNPEQTERQLQQINDIYFQVFDELYDIIREGDEMAFCYFSSWAPGKMTKLQSDISTMFSESDYRRFVQPFIREQCQRIPYTLYHLDGVGAIRHLPALLEIPELKAIQWTPGVGEPQGGSSKWYGLYRQILESGKSLMACWVTLDELKPLLDHIGGDGVHLEMDFHNEKEIEQAMRIIEPYQSKKNECSCGFDHSISIKTPDKKAVASSSQSVALEEAMKERILVLDGATGTTIQQYHLSEQDYRGKQFAQFEGNLKGCNDLLCLTRPDIPADVHKRFIEAGADIITTDTFNAQRISLQGFGIADLARDINLAAAIIARSVANRCSTPEKPIFVFGGLGPTPKCITLGEVSEEALTAAYHEQAKALMEGGVDAILIETIFDTANSSAALKAVKKAFGELGRQLPILMSFTMKNPEGFNMLGQDLMAYMLSLRDEPVCCVGLNCSLGAEMMAPFLRRLAERLPQRIIAFPNAGLPNSEGKYNQTPKIMQKVIWPLIQDHILNIVGGCCGTDDSHIREIAKLVKVDDGLWIRPHQPSEAADSVIPIPQEAAKEPTEVAEVSKAGSQEDDTLFQAIVDGKAAEAKAAAQAAIARGMQPQEIINGQMIKGMSEIGQRFQDGKAYVPHLLMSARAMKEALALLKPLMAGNTTTTLGKVVIGTVKGDLHDIGKNLVASMLEGCGFEVVNIGVDVNKESFIDAVRQNHADILCMSALLTTTMDYMKEVITALEEAGIRKEVKVMVGGAPLSQEYADRIGADGYSDNANSAVALARNLLGK